MRRPIALVGHSGCELQVRSVRGSLVTIKTSKDRAYNDRLRAQAAKQRAHAADAGSAAAVYRERVNRDGLYEFEMEYVHGQTLAQTLHALPLASLKDLARQLTGLLRTEGTPHPEVNAIFRGKLEALAPSLPKDAPPSVAEALAYLRTRDWSLCEESPCHGDLTLENVIVRDGNLYLVDFLDSFYDSWMIDVAKILQDLECMWAYRHETTPANLDLRALALKRLILDHVRSLRSEDHVALIYDLLLLGLLRILPYAQDRATFDHLYGEIDRLTRRMKA